MYFSSFLSLKIDNGLRKKKTAILNSIYIYTLLMPLIKMNKRKLNSYGLQHAITIRTTPQLVRKDNVFILFSRSKCRHLYWFESSL